MSRLPAIGAAELPADIRAAGPDARRRYEAGLGFERMLLEQLTKAMVATATSGERVSAATSAYREQLPDVLAAAVADGGGLGLARRLGGLDDVEGKA